MEHSSQKKKSLEDFVSFSVSYDTQFHVRVMTTDILKFKPAK